MRILLVDDDRELAEYVRKDLEEKVHQLTTSGRTPVPVATSAATSLSAAEFPPWPFSRIGYCNVEVTALSSFAAKRGRSSRSNCLSRPRSDRERDAANSCASRAASSM